MEVDRNCSTKAKCSVNWSQASYFGSLNCSLCLSLLYPQTYANQQQQQQNINFILPLSFLCITPPISNGICLGPNNRLNLSISNIWPHNKRIRLHPSRTPSLHSDISRATLPTLLIGCNRNLHLPSSVSTTPCGSPLFFCRDLDQFFPITHTLYTVTYDGEFRS